MKKLICKLIGHKYNLVDVTMLEITKVAINSEAFKNDTIKCKRCGYLTR